MCRIIIHVEGIFASNSYNIHNTCMSYIVYCFQLQSEQTTHETLSRFSSDPREFFRVGNDANRLDLPLLHLNGQDGKYFFISADDKGCLAVDFL